MLHVAAHQQPSHDGLTIGIVVFLEIRVPGFQTLPKVKTVSNYEKFIFQLAPYLLLSYLQNPHNLVARFCARVLVMPVDEC